MLSYVIKRCLLLLLVLVGVSIVIFILAYSVPGDPARLAAGTFASHEQVEALRQELGLDQPLYKQYIRYVGRLLHADLGVSIHTNRPIALDIRDYFTATFELITVSMIIAVIIGIILGVVSAIYHDTFTDHSLRIFSLSGVSMPVFWLALLLQLILSVKFGLLPLGNRASMMVSVMHPLQQITGFYLLDSLLTGNWPFFWDSLKHLLMPAVTLAYTSLVMITRMMRASMREVLDQDYVRTALLFGLPRRRVIYKYALKNALIPTVTVIGLAYGSQLAGAFLVETIFSWPGLGRYAAVSIINSDYPAIMGVTLLVALLYTLINFIVDMIYLLLDPRIALR